MYIQASSDDALQLPQGYSGNAFRPSEAEEPPAEETEVRAAQPPDTEEQGQRAQTEQGDTTPAGAFFGGGRKGCEERGARGGLWSTLSPLLSPFLPPPRKDHRAHGELFEWILIGAALLLFLSDSSDDLLPLLLLLLLWD
jgi:hypothetical protein